MSFDHVQSEMRSFISMKCKINNVKDACSDG